MRKKPRKRMSADWYEFKRKQDEYNAKRATVSMRESAERRRYGGKTQTERYAEAMKEKQRLAPTTTRPQ